MNDELKHYRTKGSKNGERLYQYKDGSLTPLGREHYGVGPSRQHTSAVKGYHSDPRMMTNEELRTRTERLNLERNYVEALRNYDATMDPHEFRKKLGNAFLDKTTKTIAEMTVSSGKKLAIKMLKKALVATAH